MYCANRFGRCYRDDFVTTQDKLAAHMSRGRPLSQADLPTFNHLPHTPHTTYSPQSILAYRLGGIKGAEETYEYNRFQCYALYVYRRSNKLDASPQYSFCIVQLIHFAWPAGRMPDIAENALQERYGWLGEFELQDSNSHLKGFAKII